MQYGCECMNNRSAFTSTELAIAKVYYIDRVISNRFRVMAV